MKKIKVTYRSKEITVKYPKNMNVVLPVLRHFLPKHMAEEVFMSSHGNITNGKIKVYGVSHEKD